MSVAKVKFNLLCLVRIVAYLKNIISNNTLFSGIIDTRLIFKQQMVLFSGEETAGYQLLLFGL